MIFCVEGSGNSKGVWLGLTALGPGSTRITSHTSRSIGSATEMVTHSRESRPVRLRGVPLSLWWLDVEVRVTFWIVKRRKPCAFVDDGGVSPSTSGEGGIRVIFRC